MSGLFDGLLYLWWHIGFIVLGKYFVSLNNAFHQSPIGNNALPFTKEIRKDTGINNINLLFEISDSEAYAQ